MTAKVVNKHVMALLTFLLLIPLVYFIPDWVGVGLNSLSFSNDKFINVLLSVAIIVPLISYLLMPLAIKLVIKLS